MGAQRCLSCHAGTGIEVIGAREYNHAELISIALDGEETSIGGQCCGMDIGIADVTYPSQFGLDGNKEHTIKITNTRANTISSSLEVDAFVSVFVVVRLGPHNHLTTLLSD